MPVCVNVIPSGSVVGSAGLQSVKTSVPIIGMDSSCSSGLLLLTQTELDANKIQVNTASDPERVADMASLFYAFLAALVVVWGVKQLLNLFTGDTEK
jgi:hypothetical protein